MWENEIVPPQKATPIVQREHVASGNHGHAARHHLYALAGDGFQWTRGQSLRPYVALAKLRTVKGPLQLVIATSVKVEQLGSLADFQSERNRTWDQNCSKPAFPG